MNTGTSWLFTRRAGANYEDMFSSLLKWAPTLQSGIRQEIQWAKQNLKKSNRVTWYLRWVRLALVRYALETERGGENKPQLTEYQRKLTQEIQSKGIDNPEIDFRTLTGAKAELKHLYSLPTEEIQNFDPGYDTLRDVLMELKGAEQTYIERANKYVEPLGIDEVFVDCGGGWVWWLLPRASCSAEAKAMGHCGNAPEERRKDRSILSLRQKQVEEGKSRWYPCLTFILRTEGQADSGLLGEMKGRNNNKPNAKYHPYIMRLLKDHRIKGIMGGGYKPENNFAFQDLTTAQQAQVRKANPDAHWSMQELIESGVLGTDEIAKRLGLSGEETKLPGGGVGYEIEYWRDQADFIRSCGEESAKDIQASIRDGGFALFADHMLDEIEDNDRLFQALAKQINAEFPKEHVNPESEYVRENVLATLEELADENDSTLRKGLEAAFCQGWGWKATTLDELMKAAIDDIGTNGGEDGPTGKVYVDEYGGINYYCPVDLLLDVAGRYESEVDFSYPTVYACDFESPMPNPDNVTATLAEVFAVPGLSPKQLEQHGQQRLFKRPATDQEAEREGIKVSHWLLRNADAENYQTVS